MTRKKSINIPLCIADCSADTDEGKIKGVIATRLTKRYGMNLKLYSSFFGRAKNRNGKSVHSDGSMNGMEKIDQ